MDHHVCFFYHFPTVLLIPTLPLLNVVPMGQQLRGVLQLQIFCTVFNVDSGVGYLCGRVPS
jgi:hypothetical protein